MPPIDINQAIRQHSHWRRQFINAFAGGEYADMPLSEHRACLLGIALNKLLPALGDNEDFRALVEVHHQFHARANNIVDLSENGMASSADLLLPELSETVHQLNAYLDLLRDKLRDAG